ncbi:MAG TPA: acetyl-CoA C-acyltransferase [Candidatus Dormibacteraeota bacterium]|jgi:acetyl-CoA C-acetyltransferase|nr:acetyl-CoA C-acyltransferase [Candidatus Dormibacteraeota bacterium]
MEDIVIVGAARTPIGSFLGGLAPVPAPRLGAVAIDAALDRAHVRPEQVDEVYMGNVIQAGIGQAPARQASIFAGIPNTVPCTTVNKVCGSGLKSVMLASSQIRAGEASVVVAGGMESMSNAPYLLDRARTGYKLGDATIVDAMIKDGLWDVYHNFHMGMGGELVADCCGVTREIQDDVALRSYSRALDAQRRGLFDDEIVPVEVAQPKGAPVVVSRDETPRETSREALAKLKPAFKEGGTVTAGNASKLNDGAAAVVVASASRARDLRLRPLARVVAQAQAAREPELFLLAPAEALRRLLEKTGWDVADVDSFEVNEAFAGIEAVRKELAIPEEKFNPRGGAIALGHPIGASGARLLVTLLHTLRQTGGKRGIVSLCLGGGEAVAVAVEMA